MYINGTQIGTSTNSTDFPTSDLTDVIISNSFFTFLNSNLRAAAIYTTRLSNDQLANLTRLT